MVLRISHTRTQFPTNSLFTPMDNTPLHSTYQVCATRGASTCRWDIIGSSPSWDVLTKPYTLEDRSVPVARADELSQGSSVLEKSWPLTLSWSF